MRTTEERTRLIHERTAALRKEKQKQKQRMIDVAATAACLVLVIGLGLYMPGLMGTVSKVGVMHVSGAASMIGEHAGLGYIVIGIGSFLLGMCLTILLYRLHLKHDQEQQEDTNE